MPVIVVFNTPPGCGPHILASRVRGTPTRRVKASRVFVFSSQHHRIGRASRERGIRRGGEGQRSDPKVARNREIRAGRRIRGLVAHLRREFGAAGRDDVDAGQDEPVLVHTGREFLSNLTLMRHTSAVQFCGWTLIDGADQGDGGLRLGRRGEDEGAAEREQRRGERPGGAGERAPRQRQAHEPRRPAGGGCGLRRGMAAPRGQQAVRRRGPAEVLRCPRRSHGARHYYNIYNVDIVRQPRTNQAHRQASRASVSTQPARSTRHCRHVV